VRSFKIPNSSPITELFQTAGASITANFFHHVAQSACLGEIFIDLPVPSGVVALANECSELSQFFVRKLINRGFDFDEGTFTSTRGALP